MNGPKRSAKAMGCKNTSVGERSVLEGSTRASGGGRSRTRMWAQTLVKIQCPENPRVPPQSSSTEGESGSKIRLKCVVDGYRFEDVR